MTALCDVLVMRDDELMIAHVEGLSELGVEFVDAYNPIAYAETMQVIDSGRIIVPIDALDALCEEAKTSGLSIEGGGSL